MSTGIAENIKHDSDERIELARSLLAHLEAGDDEKVSETIDNLTNLRESQIFQEVGQLTRQLHNSLGNCYDDDKFTSLASTDIPNARERLKYVIEKTEDSANRTLTAIELAEPLSEELKSSARQMSDDWERFKRREMNAEDFRALAKKITAFLETVTNNSEKVHEHLTEVMMAQEYQDLTGQIINQVISIVEDVETNLVNLIKCQGGSVCVVDETGPDIKAEGPQVNPVDKSKVVSGQDEVDDLLSSLGF